LGQANSTLLPAPARYRPWSKGVYEVTPSLRPFGTDFGNGVLDRQVFQFDSERDRFLANKREAAERAALHSGEYRLTPKVAEAAANWIADKLTTEHPEIKLGSMLASPRERLDFLVSQVQEDLCIVSTNAETDWISCVNVCAPSHWDPSSKLGLSFFDGHQIVPGMERINQGAAGLVDAMVRKGPWVRFVWGLETDDRLNHHPTPPEGRDAVEWDGRLFDVLPYCVRFERQVIWGLPEVDASVFVIRVGFTPGSEVRNDPALVSAVRSMSPASREYKGIARYYDSLLAQLEGRFEPGLVA
jgi:hypothetical protein